MELISLIKKTKIDIHEFIKLTKIENRKIYKVTIYYVSLEQQENI